MRATLFQVDENDYVFVVSMHHIVCDGWSLGIFCRELAALYAAFARPAVAAAGAADSVRRLTRNGSATGSPGDVLDGQSRYWKEALRTCRVLELPTDRAASRRRRASEARGMSCEFPMPSGRRSTPSASSEGATLFMTLLAAFDVLLHRYSRPG